MTTAPHITDQFHPVAEIFPMMSDREFLDLVEDIRQYGLREPVWLHRDGRIIDGRNRFMACREVGIEPATRTYDGPDDSLVEFVLSLNLHRRHLSESQRAMVAARIANMRQGERTDLEPSANLPKVSQAVAAQQLQVSERSVRDAKRVQDHAVPELATLVDAGEIAVSSAAQVADVVRERAAGLAPERVKEVVHEAIAERREQVAKQRADRQALDDLAKELDLPKVDEKAEDARIATTHEFYRAVHALAILPPATEVAALIPDYQRYRLEELSAAVAWINDFAAVWKELQ